MRQIIRIPPIVLEWSDWVTWDELLFDTRRSDAVRVPNRRAGVYEVKYVDEDEKLAIGKAANLRMRVERGLVKGKTPHSAGKRIRASEKDTSRIVVRWAVTDKPACVEEELHRLHREEFDGRLPRYTQHT